jgi:uncharacterized protein (DUF1810 family)
MQAPSFDLERFVAAQEPVMATVLDELRNGRKRSHWMWFVFPQLAGLGSSAMARRFALASVDEAKAYLAHPTLGPRLELCCTLVIAAPGSATDILGSPDDLKFRSCLKLFQIAAPHQAVFQKGLDRFYSGQPDPRTLHALGARP